VAAKTVEELNQLNKNSDKKQEGIRHIKAKLGESLKKILESKVTNGQYIRRLDRQLISKEDKFL
jgi:septation ring formation regulator EzrA